VHVRIGMIYSNKELEVELSEDQDGDQLIEQITGVMGNETGVLWLTDRKGRRVGVASAKIAYIEIAADSETRRVGFSAL
jgi:hypothetical protein